MVDVNPDTPIQAHVDTPRVRRNHSQLLIPIPAPPLYHSLGSGGPVIAPHPTRDRVQRHFEPTGEARDASVASISAYSSDRHGAGPDVKPACSNGVSLIDIDCQPHALREGS